MARRPGNIPMIFDALNALLPNEDIVPASELLDTEAETLIIAAETRLAALHAGEPESYENERMKITYTLEGAKEVLSKKQKRSSTESAEV